MPISSKMLRTSGVTAARTAATTATAGPQSTGTRQRSPRRDVRRTLSHCVSGRSQVGVATAATASHRHRHRHHHRRRRPPPAAPISVRAVARAVLSYFAAASESSTLGARTARRMLSRRALGDSGARPSAMACTRSIVRPVHRVHTGTRGSRAGAAIVSPSASTMMMRALPVGPCQRDT